MKRWWLAALAALLAGSLASRGRAAQNGVVEGPWYHIGPFVGEGLGEFNDAAPPEQGINLGAKCSCGLQWDKRAEWADGVVYDLPAADHANTYLYRTLTVAAPTTVTGYFGSDDGMVLWLNGKKLISKDVPRGAGPNQDTCKLELHAGENQLLFKIHNNTGGHAFYFSLNPQPAAGAAKGPVAAPVVDTEALRRAITDLTANDGDQYPQGQAFLTRLDAAEKAKAAANTPEAATKANADLEALQREALLANPLVKAFDKVIFVRRAGNLGLPANWQGNASIARVGYDTDLEALSLRDGTVTTLYKPEGGRFVGNLTLHWDADRLLFSMPDAKQMWQIYEIKTDGSGLREVGPADEPDVDNYDACYLPSGKIVFASTRVFAGVPCVGGSDAAASLCQMDGDGSHVRMLCFDQDQNWCPTVMNDGKVMYTRWEYSDTAHYFTRLLFAMNPDGTQQFDLSHSNSYWPNSMFYTRAIPGSDTKVVTIASGHHGVPRMGELVLFDLAQGRHEANGAIQRIPGWGKKVEPKIADTLVDNSWPKFLHPYPLSDKYFLVSCKPTPSAEWGLYLVDVFDNMLLLKQTPGSALLEPLAVQPRPVPPVVPDKVDLTKTTASVYLADIYDGPGLRGVPRGTVKKLRLYSPHYAYNKMGGHINIGIEGPWDVRRILGTVPVNPDGSAAFEVPANTPISFQPLDSEGRALQAMRSWYTGMPGEIISCAGCHESQNQSIERKQVVAATQPPSAIEPWHGPTRGFSWKREIQGQVLDKFCVGCHDGKTPTNGKVAPLDLTAKARSGWGNFPGSYEALHPYVRRHGPEGDDHMMAPMEYCANTSELVQMLQKGHHNVKLDAEAWDRLYTWIDLNVPAHGTWGESGRIARDEVGSYHDRRLAMRSKYAGVTEDPEVIPPLDVKPVAFIPPEPEPPRDTTPVKVEGWPFDTNTAKQRQAMAASQLRFAAQGGEPTRRVIDLGDGQKMEFVLIPAGEFVMGSLSGCRDELPLTRVRIDRPFWMSTTTVTNAQYHCFDAEHNSRYIKMQHKDHTGPGYPANLPKMPVIRVPWQRAMQFTQWLSKLAGAKCQLPTEAQWEWACRAGTETPFWYGDLDTDFGKKANLADFSIKLLAVDGVNPQPVKNPNPVFQDFVPREPRFNDGHAIVCDVASYDPNPWGLYDMHGNVAEWTRSAYKPYPYVDGDGRNDGAPEGLKAVRGGSWRDRPFRGTSSFRLAYFAYQPVFDVGFRVILEDAGGQPKIALAGP
jgi:formylglycine-generating enzyme required for sulfatase activity